MSLFLDVSIIGQPPELEFRKDRDHTFCRICGRVFQPALNRIEDALYTEGIQAQAQLERIEWAVKHGLTHPDWEHERLRRSGRFLTPEAALALVPYGIIPIEDIVFSDESEQAGLEAKRMPEDIETTLKGGVSFAR